MSVSFFTWQDEIQFYKQQRRQYETNKNRNQHTIKYIITDDT